MRQTLTAIAAFAALSACSTYSDTTGATTPVPDTEKPVELIAENTTYTASADPYLWLEEVEGEAALSWVRSQNERSLADIQSHPAYADNLAKAMDLATSEDRIPYGTIRDGMVYNFWQDEANTRGLWRRTTLDSYETDNPVWETVLDFDQLSADEDKNWVFKGSDCFRPKSATRTLCMVSLSDGGKDAIIRREFDLDTKTFVENGFVTTEAKQGTAWVDHDTMLVATDWGSDGSTLTESGYPTSVRLWKRGEALEDAPELYAGQKTDVGVWPWSTELDDGRMIYGAIEADTFFTSSYWLLSDGQPFKFPIPAKSSLGADYKGHQFVTLQEDWTIEAQGRQFKIGDLVAFNLDEMLETKTLPDVNLVFRANDRQAVNGVSVAKGAALLSINDNVASKVLRLEPIENGWSTSEVTLPGTGQASIAFADKKSGTVFINYEGFLTPDSLLKYDVTTSTVSPLKSLPAKFDTTGLVVHQKEATSTDGTKIPYFVVHKEGIALDGSNPTLLYGYGGFEVSLRPSYSGGIGRLWLEKGGIYVLANIRGGGEFGPAWHQAGLKGNRQRIYDDFKAVGQGLFDLNITSPERLGIMGGSNGGLLMGVMITQAPDMWNAVVIQVPLLDMLRYHKLLAGASWIDEYGDPDIAEERAFLETISPYQNFDATGDYPMPLFVTSTKDDRVHPGHARKMAKLFEAAGKPFLYYENIDGGHSAAANQKERAKRTALEFTYLYERLFPKDAE
ncbi:MAG: prolyl oligopeptidase family serine peptidase [Henriciella sp.]|nr:prolyl oligopeptidase family serine peptidase [Henriciella sp.]